VIPWKTIAEADDWAFSVCRRFPSIDADLVINNLDKEMTQLIGEDTIPPELLAAILCGVIRATCHEAQCRLASRSVPEKIMDFTSPQAGGF